MIKEAMGEVKEAIGCKEPGPCHYCPKRETSECWPTEILEQVRDEYGHEIVRRGGQEVFERLAKDSKEWAPEKYVKIDNIEDLSDLALVILFGEVTRILNLRAMS